VFSFLVLFFLRFSAKAFLVQNEDYSRLMLMMMG